MNTGDQTITLTGDVTGTGTGTFTSTITNSAVTYAKMQNVTAGKLLGSISASDAAPGAVAIGSGLTLSGGTLTASGTGGTVTSVNPITLTTTGSTFTSTVANASTTPAITLNIPSASVTGTTAGLLSNTDYAAFNGKQSALTAGTGSGISISGGTISATGITTANLSATAGITNGQLANSAITLGSTSMSLGSTNTTIAGLTSVTSTGFTGALTGNASTATALATARLIYGGSFNGTADVTSIIASTFGGTGNGFAKFTGPTTAEKTFTLPDASATILTSNAAVTAAQGGTSQSTYATGDILYASATNTLSKLGIGATGTVLTVSGGVPSWANNSGITGTGTQNYLPKYNNAGGTTLGNSLIFDNGTSVGINTASPGSAFKLDVNGAANFASDIVVNGIKIGKRLDPGYEMYATSYGVNALANYVVGAYGATAFGNNALQANTNGAYNNAFGIGTLSSLTTGSGNTAIGSYASNETSDASNNVIIGHEAGRYINTSDNTIIGWRAGQTCCTTNSVNIKNTYIGSGSGNGTAGSKNVIIGSFSGSSLGTINNNIILSDGDGTIRYRWDGTTNNFNTGSVTASSFIKTGGTNAQYLMADGSTSAGPSGGVTTISGGTTGLTPANATSGVVTLAGTLIAANGGTGQNTYAIGDILYASSTSALSKLTIGSAGQVLTVSSGIPSWGSNGLYSLNGITSGTHSLTTGLTGTDFNISSSGSTHTFNIPDAGATSTTRGLVSINAQTFYGAKTFNSDLIANGYTIGKGNGNVSSNLAIGSGNFHTTSSTGTANLAIGTNALFNNRTGQFSTSVGHYTLTSSSTGTNNNAFGYYALFGGYGSYNTAIGDSALSGYGTSILNTAVGNSSMKSNTSGSFNTAVGNNSLITNTTGTYNTAIGINANVFANNLTNATAIGANATVSASNTIQLGNTSVTDVKTSGALTTGAVTYPIAHGSNGQVLSTTGSGTLTWTTAAGGISGTGTQNYLPKYGAGGTTLGNSSIFDNGTSVGISTTTPGSTFKLDVNGAANFSSDIKVIGLTIGVGRNIEMNNDQKYYNTAVGISSLSVNTTGKSNTAVGMGALAANTTGAENAALGWQTLKVNTTGNENLAFGQNTLGANIAGNANTGVGSAALEASNAGGNTAVGASSLRSNQSGNNNTAIGYGALYNSGGTSFTSGNNNTVIGSFTNITSGKSNSTAIGAEARVTADNTIRLGNSSIVTISGQVGFSTSSDIRIKKNITNSKYGLSTLLKLRPVDYTLISNNLEQVGFIAQEVQKLVPEVITGNEGDLEKGEILGITYSNLVPVLAKAIQEQQKQIEEQNNKIASQQKQIDELKALFNKLLNQNKSQK